MKIVNSKEEANTHEDLSKLPKCKYCGQITTRMDYHLQECKKYKASEINKQMFTKLFKNK